MKKLIFLITFVFVLSGCSGIPVKEYKNKTVTGNYYDKNYSLNIPRTINVGEELVKVVGGRNGRLFEFPIFETTDLIEIELPSKELRWTTEFSKQYGLFMETKLQKNTKFLVTKEVTIENEDYYISNFTMDAFPRLGRNYYLINKKNLNIDKKFGYVFVANGTVLSPIKELNSIINSNAIRLIGKHYIILTPESEVNFDIVFNGVSGDTLRFTYREFTKTDLARPAYYQDLTYNKNDKIIKFKDLEIQVLKVTSNEITYKIIKDGFINTF